MSTDLANYGTVTTKDLLARRLYNNETGGSNPVGIIIESVNKCLDIDAGTTISIASAGNMDIVAGAGLDIAVTGAVDIQASTTATLEADGGLLYLSATAGGVTIQSSAATQLTAGANAQFDITGTYDTNVSGAITLDSSASTIGIGNDSVNGAINVGTGGSRAIAVGNSNATTTVFNASAIASTFSLGTGGFTLDTVDGGAVSLDAVGAPSNFSLAATADADDLTVSVTGAHDASLILASAGTNAANAIEITASAGGLDMNVNNNKTENVGGTSVTTVTGNVTEDFNASRDTNIAVNETFEVTGTSTLTRTGATTLAQVGDETVTNTGNATKTVNGATGYVLDVAKNINIDSNKDAANAIVINASNATGGLDINTGSGGVDILTADGGQVSIDATGAPSNFSLAATADDDDLTVSVTGSSDASLILSSTGTNAANAIEITASVGGLDMNVAGNKTEDVVGNSTDTTTGNAAETVTGNKTVTVNGTTGFTLDVAKIINIDSNDATAGAVKIAASNAAGGIDIDAGTGGIHTNTTGADVSTTTGVTTATRTGAETITNGSSATRTCVGQFSVTSNQAAGNAVVIDAANAAGGIDIDCGTGGINITSTGAGSSVTMVGQDGASLTTTLSASDITISAVGGGAQVVQVASAGTGTDALDFNATAGGLDVDVALGVDIQAGSGDINIDTTSGDIRIGTDETGTDVFLGDITASSTSNTKAHNIYAYGLLDVADNTNLHGNCTIDGNLTVDGTTVTMNTTTVVSEDKNIELNTGTSATETDAGAVGGGFTLKGDTNKTFMWSDVNTDSTNDSWDSSEDINIADAKHFTINKKRALNQSQCYIATKTLTSAANDLADKNGGLYLNSATPETEANGNWRIKIDFGGDVVFQKRVAGSYQNKFRIQ